MSMLRQELIKLVSQGAMIAKDKAIQLLNSEKRSESSPQIDSKWITLVTGNFLTHSGYVLSAFYHPTKTHSATTEGVLGIKKSIAEKGKWAVSIQTRGAYGNKAFYNIQQDKK